MNTNLLQTRISALQALGYTEDEARFLYLVATHSGYFVARQFLCFTGASWGKRTTLFWNKLQAGQHARTYRFAKGGTAYHLFSRRVYRQIGRENLRNRREHELEYILARIAMLDFVLGNLDLDYLETEPDKVAFFCTELQLPKHHLPSKTYSGRYTATPTVRYFVDRSPMFFPASPAKSRIVTFTYIQGAEANLAGFAHHLQMYLPLFRELSEFRFLFLARANAHFAKAAELFRDLVTIPLQSNPAEDLLRYFTIRKAWDLAQYTSLTEADLIFRNLAKERFAGARFEHLYRAWKPGRLADAEIRADLRGSDKPHAVQFDTQILRAIGPSDGETEASR
jgi:hypothetical protein